MKKFVKAVALSVCLLLACTTFFACGRGGGKKTDDSKLQLNIGTFGGGIGVNWINEAIERFEKKYENVAFSGGKVGVEVEVYKEEKYRGKIASRIKSFVPHIIMTEEAEYHSLTDLIVDITDVLNTPINQDMITGKKDTSFGTGNETIAGIMNTSIDDYLNVGGRYYAVPYYGATMGIVYDIDLFEKYGFYYAAEGYGDSEGFIQDKNGRWIGKSGAVVGDASTMTFAQALEAGVKLGLGPDGVESDDDGQPQTYDDFFKLAERIYQRGVIPFTFTGKDDIPYINQLAYNLWADYMGAEQMAKNYTLTGHVTDLIDMASFNPSTGAYTTTEDDVTIDTGYKLQRQAGKYEGIKFIKRFTDNQKYYDPRSQTSQREAEQTYIYSVLNNQKDRAMLIDGTWWMSEASSVFDNMVSDYRNESYSAANRRFGMLSLPKADKTKLGKQTLVLNNENLILLNKTAIERSDYKDDVMRVAKQFVKFLHTHESFYQFNKITSSFRPFNYELTEEELDTMTSVAKQNYTLYRDVDFLFTYSQNPIVKNTPQLFCSAGGMVYQMSNGEDWIISLTFFNGKCSSAWDYFKSVVDHYDASYWGSHFAQYYS